MQGIYRISGAKARVEKLCQAFENGRELVELSEHSPHDITGVLKHFLKEVGSKSPGGARISLWSWLLPGSWLQFLVHLWEGGNPCSWLALSWVFEALGCVDVCLL